MQWSRRKKNTKSFNIISDSVTPSFQSQYWAIHWKPPENKQFVGEHTNFIQFVAFPHCVQVNIIICTHSAVTTSKLMMLLKSYHTLKHQTSYTRIKETITEIHNFNSVLFKSECCFSIFCPNDMDKSRKKMYRREPVWFLFHRRSKFKLGKEIDIDIIVSFRFDFNLKSRQSDQFNEVIPICVPNIKWNLIEMFSRGRFDKFLSVRIACMCGLGTCVFVSIDKKNDE